VSAVTASPTASGSSRDPVRALQHALYRAAKADPGRRFHALSDKVYRRDVLERAWVNVRRNGGAAGIDRKTIADVEEYGFVRLLDELAADLRDGRWRPAPARRVLIPKPGTREQRPLSIPREVFLRRVQGRFSTLASRLQMSTEPTKIPSVRYSFLERALGTPQ
jgi:hypothetical protein